MARDDVTTQLVAHLQGALEIDPRASPPACERRARQRLGRGIDGEKAASILQPSRLDRRQATAGAGDRRAKGDRVGVITRRNGEARVAALLDVESLADIGDNSGKHSALSSGQART